MQTITSTFLNWKAAINERDAFLNGLAVWPFDFPERKEDFFSLCQSAEAHHRNFVRMTLSLNGRVWFEVEVEGEIYTGRYLFDLPFARPDLVLIVPSQIIRIERRVEFLGLLDDQSRVHQLGVVCAQSVTTLYSN
jgi:hypothetical protein